VEGVILQTNSLQRRRALASEIFKGLRHVRLAPKSGHRETWLECPLCAIRGQWHHSVSERQEIHWQLDARRLAAISIRLKLAVVENAKRAGHVPL